MQNDQRPPLVVILGPTAVGKTELAILLAEFMNGEIVSADSLLFYRGMDIGTAKPTLEERARVAHHLIDVTTPDNPWSLAVFQQQAHLAISQIAASGKVPILVGGTGQYVRAIIEGWQMPKQQPAPHLRMVLENWGTQIGVEELHARLAIIDPQAAERIEPRNLRRIVRALEVIFLTGKRFSSQKLHGPAAYRLLLIGLNRPRPELYERIDRRISHMLAQGLEAEVRRLLAKYPPDLPVFQAIGYREMIAHLQGNLALEEVEMLMKRRTRKLVRRQSNWFKHSDPTIVWLDVGPGTDAQMAALVKAFMAT